MTTVTDMIEHAASPEAATTVGNRFYATVARAIGFDGRPQRVDPAEFIPSDGRVYYHGMNAEHVPQFLDGPLYSHNGAWGGGIYTTPAKNFASTYADGQPDGVISMRLADDAKIATSDEMYAWRSELLAKAGSTPDPVEAAALASIANDHGLIAMYHGVDAYQPEKPDEFVIVNRSKIVVPGGVDSLLVDRIGQVFTVNGMRVRITPNGLVNMATDEVLSGLEAEDVRAQLIAKFSPVAPRAVVASALSPKESQMLAAALSEIGNDPDVDPDAFMELRRRVANVVSITELDADDRQQISAAMRRLIDRAATTVGGDPDVVANWGVINSHSALPAATRGVQAAMPDSDLTNVDDLIMEASASKFRYVVADTPDGKLISFSQDPPEDDTMVWLDSEGEENAVTLAEMVDRFGVDDVDLFLEPEYVISDPAAVTAAILPSREEVAIEVLAAYVASLEAKVASLVLQQNPTVEFGSGLTEAVLRGAVAGDPTAQAEMIAVFDQNADPTLSPSQFAEKIMGPPLEDGHPLAGVWKAGADEAKVWQARSIAGGPRVDPVTAAIFGRRSHQPDMPDMARQAVSRAGGQMGGFDANGLWHDPHSGRFAAKGFVSPKVLKKLLAGDGEARSSFLNTIADKYDPTIDRDVDSLTSHILGPRPTEPGDDRNAWDAGWRLAGGWLGTKVGRPEQQAAARLLADHSPFDPKEAEFANIPTVGKIPESVLAGFKASPDQYRDELDRILEQQFGSTKVVDPQAFADQVLGGFSASVMGREKLSAGDYVKLEQYVMQWVAQRQKKKPVAAALRLLVIRRHRST